MVRFHFLWRTHFERYVTVNGADLDRSQLALIQKASGQMTARFFRTPKSDPTHARFVAKPIEEMLVEAYEIFTEEEIGALFFRLGSVDYQPGPALKAPFNNCKCSQDFDCLSPDPVGFCLQDSLFCTPVNSGCGPFNTDACSGQCF